MHKSLDRSELKYTGNRQPEPGKVDRFGRLLQPYLPTDELVEAVNLAIYLERPLLLRGEPGCGKTRLAEAVAYELNLHYEAWHVKSTSRANDGLYTYDAIKRLGDAQLVAAFKGRRGVPFAFEEVQNYRAIQNYIKMGPIGRAFQEDEKPTVLLIDEIDKADIDFPNDLLEILEDKRFVIGETGESVNAKHTPIIFITSNDEKELPEPFLRRCLFSFIKFPQKERLLKILNAHFNGPPNQLAEKAIERFLQLRQRQEQDAFEAPKKVSTSELIDWFRILMRSPDHELGRLKSGRPYPYQSTLIKRREDLDYCSSPMIDKDVGE